MYGNVTVLFGRATKKPELRQVGNSQACTIRMVSNKRIKGRDGEWTEKSTYIDAECWGSRAEYAARAIDKGTMILVVGELEQDEWESNGEKKQKHKIYVSFDLQVLRLPGQGSGDGEERETASAGTNRGKARGKSRQADDDDGGDSLPF